MISCTELDLPKTEHNKKRYNAIDFWEDPKTNEEYFYFTLKIYDNTTYEFIKTDVYRFKIDGNPLKEELVGSVDFSWSHGHLSFDGLEFWLFDYKVENKPESGFIFRKINPETLEVKDYLINGQNIEEIGDIVFYYNALFYQTNHGIFLLIDELSVGMRSLQPEPETRHTHVFKFWINEPEKYVDLEKIELSKSPLNYTQRTNAFEALNWRLGLSIIDGNLLFYHISFDAKVYVCDFDSDKEIEWKEWKMDGDVPESGYVENDWEKTGRNHESYESLYLRHGVYLKFDRSNKSNDYYKLEFDVKKKICRFNHMFCTTNRLFISPQNTGLLYPVGINPIHPWTLEVGKFNVFERLSSLRQVAYWKVRDLIRNGKRPEKISTSNLLSNPYEKSNEFECSCQNKKKSIYKKIGYSDVVELLSFLSIKSEENE